MAGGVSGLVAGGAKAHHTFTLVSSTELRKRRDLADEAEECLAKEISPHCIRRDDVRGGGRIP